ncbi:MAG: hypothetical protein JSU09_15135 [Bacteroidetes bacterium]|nr:hypothetical protein [Bacteroidota bacterium]
MRFGYFFSLLFIVGCSFQGRQVNYREFGRPPKFKWDGEKLLIMVDPENSFSIDYFEVDLDTTEMIVTLRGFTRGGRKLNFESQANLPFIPKLHERYTVAWTDEGGTQTNLRREVKFGGENCSPYFIYDAIEHYHSTISDSVLSRLFEEKYLTQNERRLLNFVVDYEYDRLLDTVSLKDIKSLGFSQKDILQSRFKVIDDIMCQSFEPNDDDIDIRFCIPYYRDVLVFKTNGFITGYAKICFTCQQYMFVGTTKNTWEFDSKEKFEALQEILDLE